MNTVASSSDVLLTSPEQWAAVLGSGVDAARQYSRTLFRGSARNLLTAALGTIDVSLAGLHDRNVNVPLTLDRAGAPAPPINPPAETASEVQRLRYACAWMRLGHVLGHVNTTAILDQLAAIDE